MAAAEARFRAVVAASKFLYPASFGGTTLPTFLCDLIIIFIFIISC